MAKFEVPVIKITKVEDHPSADRLSLVYFRGFATVSAKLSDGSHRYKEGDLAIYVPEGAVVPDYLLRKGFWNEKDDKGMLAGSKGNRVKAILLRGILSRGIMFTVDMFEGFDETKHFCLAHSHPDVVAVEGMDVAELLGIVKYEPVIPTSLSGDVLNVGYGTTVNFDIESIQKYPDEIANGDDVVATEKLHGTSCHMYYVPGLAHPELIDDFFVTSKGLGARGLALKLTKENLERNAYVKAAMKVFNKEKFDHVSMGRKITILGELVGKGIQDLQYGLTTPQIFVFDVAIDDVWLGYDEMIRVCSVLDLLVAPLVYRGEYSEDVLKHADGNTTLTENHIREGIVVKHCIPRYNKSGSRIHLKMVSSRYLLRKNGTEYA